MTQLLQSESTSFSLDNMGRYLCNTLQEAVDSTMPGVAGQSRAFDVIVIGGGTFGSVIAHSLFTRDQKRSRRILVLEAGPFVLPEHFQNLPFMGGTPDWRRPWIPSTPDYQFPGLLFAVGGRSMAWGGWSPELLHDANDDEMVNWPAAVIQDLQSRYFLESADQIGVSATNDFIHGPLHEAMRRQLFDGLAAGSGAGGPFAALKLTDLPDHPVVRSYKRKTKTDPGASQLREWLNLPANDKTSVGDMLDLLKLEAPLAVQARTEPGLFPINKFSAIPLLIQAARIAASETGGTGAEADARKRLMVVPNCHVQDIITETQPDNWVRVVGVRALDQFGNSHDVPLLPPRANGEQSIVVIALGTIESSRLALQTFKDSLGGRAAQRMGKNLLGHLRSNLTIRIPKSSLRHIPPSIQKEIEASALFVKGKKNIRGNTRYFHIQITASGLTRLGNSSEASLFRKIPDIDHVNNMLQADDNTVVITFRAIGEMSPKNPESFVELAQFDFDFNRPAAFVTFGNAKAASGGSAETQIDRELWAAMDEFSNRLALLFANGQPYEVLTDKSGKVVQLPAGAMPIDDSRRDGLGTTHHEAGTLWMHEEPAKGVTNPDGRIHDTTNCYVLGPALFPMTGSPNPMLTGVALGRRMADFLNGNVLPKPAPQLPSPGFTAIFDGTGTSFNQWTRVSAANSNGFALVNGEIVTYGTQDFGLLYFAGKYFKDFTLRVQFRMFDLRNQNSGIFVRFRDPLLDPTEEILKRIQNESNDYQLFQRNRAWSAVHSGFEIQIDDNALGDVRKDFYGTRPEPNGLRKNRTGAVYKIPAKDPIPGTNQFDAEIQKYQPAPDLTPGNPYQFEINVRGNDYTVDLADMLTGTTTRTTSFTNTDHFRGIAEENGAAAACVGIQSYPNSVFAFRWIEIKE